MLDFLADVLTAPQLWAGVVSVVSAYLVYRTGVKNGERQIQADRDREEAATKREAAQLEHQTRVGALTAKRQAYTDLLHSIDEVLAWIAVQDEIPYNVTAMSSPRPAPAETLNRLAERAARATLEANPALAASITALHSQLVNAAARHPSDGRAALPALTNPIEEALPALRQALREDLERA